MSTNTDLEKRVEALEQELSAVKALLSKIQGSKQLWWESTAGTFKDDPAFDEMVELGRQYRKSQGPEIE